MSGKMYPHGLRCLALVAAAVLIASPALADKFAAQVTEVVKGDVLKVTRDGTPQTIRLNSVDCPEVGQPFGAEAKRFASDLAMSKEVTVNTVGEDAEKRTVAVVILADGSDLGRQLLAAGLGWFDEKNALSDGRLRSTAAKAISSRKGLWADGAPLAPWDYRRDMKKNRPEVELAVPASSEAGAPPGPSAAVFVTKTDTDYHRTGCIHLDRTKRVTTVKQAEADGYKPCRICFPPKPDADAPVLVKKKKSGSTGGATKAEGSKKEDASPKEESKDAKPEAKAK